MILKIPIHYTPIHVYIPALITPMQLDLPSMYFLRNRNRSTRAEVPALCVRTRAFVDTRQHLLLHEYLWSVQLIQYNIFACI